MKNVQLSGLKEVNLSDVVFGYWLDGLLFRRLLTDPDSVSTFVTDTCVQLEPSRLKCKSTFRAGGGGRARLVTCVDVDTSSKQSAEGFL